MTGVQTCALPILEKYYGLGFDVGEKHAPEQYKDYNEWLQAAKKPVSVIRGTKKEENTVNVFGETKTEKIQSTKR